MSGINDVGDGCVLEKWVCRSQPRFVLFVRVTFYFLVSVLSSLQNNWRCWFALVPLSFEVYADRFECK